MAGTTESRQATYGGGLRQIAIVVLLVAGLVILHRFSVPPETPFDPTAMLAFGFVVLASYAIGQLVEVLRLPHITGYLVAGVLLGASIPRFLPVGWRLPPFDEGVLNRDVIEQLGLLDTLAVALIALTAGGELKLEGLRKGIKAIAGILSGQLASVVLLVTAFVWAISGAVPEIALPGIVALPAGTAIVLGLTVAAISFSTSPAATIAVINGSGAKGPMSRTVLSTVVLKDVFVVVGFSVASTLAGRMLGETAMEGNLGNFLLTHIMGSLLVGVVLGGAIALYLRYVGQEILLFLVGVIYVAAFVADGLHLDQVLLFLAAGFTVANFSRKGGTLIHNVERLSMPVYVVFFTLAGARVHLDELFMIAPFAIGLVLVRGLGMWAGAVMGTRFAGVDPATARFGWMGFMSQAGVSISLTAILATSFGELGRALATLLLSAIAVNELVGPVLLKVALGLARELPGQRQPTDEAPRETARPSRPPPPDEWKEHEDLEDAWGGRPTSSSERVVELLYDLQSDLQALVRDLARGSLEEFRRDAETYLRELRREFLRHHRRLVVSAREMAGTEEAEGTEGAAASKRRAALAARLRTEQAELAERWRGIVLGRAARVRQSTWTPEDTAAAVDRLVDALPVEVGVPWEPRSFVHPSDEGPVRAAQRSWLRLRRGTHRLFGSSMPLRTLELRQLARYHLSGEAPTRLEGLATLLVQADQHLTSRTRSLFDAIVSNYDSLAARAPSAGVDPADELARMHQDVEEELALAFDEIARMVRDASRRTAHVLGAGLRRVKQESGTFGTLDLPSRSRRSSRVYRHRVRALETLGEGMQRVRRATAGGYSRLGMELELVAVEARIKDALEEFASRLESDVRGRAHIQAERVQGALQEALDGIEEALAKETSGTAMAAAIRRTMDAAERVAGEAAHGAGRLRDQLMDETTGASLLDALGRSARGLTERYEIGTRLPRAEWKLPAAPPPVEVPFRELVHAYIDTQVAPKLLAATREAADKVQPLTHSLQELERLIAFNAELATGELEVAHDEAVPERTRTLLRDMLAGALERSLAMVDGFVASSSAWPQQLAGSAREAVLGGLEELRGRLVDADITRARVEAMRRSAAGRRLVRGAGELPGRLSRSRRELGAATRWLLGDERLERWRLGLGLPSRRGARTDDADALAPPRVADDLPLVYRRLFAPDTLEAADVLTGRDPDIARARRVLGGRTPGRLRAVALVGPDGVGKAAVSTAIVRARAWKNVRRVNLTGPISSHEVLDLFKDRTEGHLIVIDGLHWMVAMRPGGLEPLRRFVEGVLADGGRNAWLVQADQLFWRYASHIAPLEEAFPEVVRLDPLGPVELQSAVLARHALSGYGLDFEPDRPRTGLEGLLVRIAGKLRRPYERYFRQLHAASGGLVRDAMRLWLASIEKVDERQDFVHVGPLPRPPVAALRRLPDDMLLNLYVIARQGWMTPDIQAWVFRVDRGTAEAQLARLAHVGLLQQNDGVFRITVHLRGAVVQVLKERGWVD